MNSDHSNRRVIDRVQIPERWVLLLLAVAALAFIAFSARLNDGSTIEPVQDFTNGAISQFEVGTASEPNGSIDPFAPYFGEGDMTEQSVVTFHDQSAGTNISRACFLAIPCW